MRVQANAKGLFMWADGTHRARYDYDTDEHVLSEILNDTYFGVFAHRLREGDQIHITDAAKERVTVLCDHVDKDARRIMLSVEVEHRTQPVMTLQGEKGEKSAPAYAYRWRGPRGGSHCIVDANGEIVHRDLQSKADAERVLQNMLEAKKAA